MKEIEQPPLTIVTKQLQDTKHFFMLRLCFLIYLKLPLMTFEVTTALFLWMVHKSVILMYATVYNTEPRNVVMH